MPIYAYITGRWRCFRPCFIRCFWRCFRTGSITGSGTGSSTGSLEQVSDHVSEQVSEPVTKQMRKHVQLQGRFDMFLTGCSNRFTNRLCVLTKPILPTGSYLRFVWRFALRKSRSMAFFGSIGSHWKSNRSTVFRWCFRPCSWTFFCTGSITGRWSG